MNQERRDELWKLFCELEFREPPDTLVQYGLKNGKTYKGHMYCQTDVTNVNGEEESGVIIEVIGDDDMHFDAIPFSFFDFVKYGDTVWEDK